MQLAPPIEPRQETLLLVEDDTSTRELLALLLSGEGWLVLPAETGEAAIALLEESGRTLPHLALCDLNLPGLSGAGLARAIRSVAQRRFPNDTINLLAMTATKVGSAEGYSSVLIKPFPAAAVRERLAAVATSQIAAEVISTSSDQALPLIDMNAFQQMRKSMPADRLKELYAFAVADAGIRLGRMESSKELSEIRKEAHAIKGSFGVIGAPLLRALASEIEGLHATDGTELGTLPKKVSELRDAVEQFRLMLEGLFP